MVEERASHGLQLILSPGSLQRLDRLRDDMGASSYGEVIRRALDLYEVYEPEDGALPGGVTLGDVDGGSVAGRRVKEASTRLHVALPADTVDQLKRLKEETGAPSYAELIRQALRILAQAWQMREKIRAEIRAGREATEDDVMFLALTA